MKKTGLFLMSALLIFASCEQEEITGKPAIHVNQVGFYPAAVKQCVTVNTLESEFAILDAESGQEVFRGKLEKAGRWDGTPDEKSIRLGDFSGLTTPGTYVVSVEGAGQSYPFTIAEHVYRDALHASLKTFYFQRASFPIEEKYAGKWRREAGHPDTNLIFHEESGHTGNYASPGGWYDAGDYAKYTVNAGITVWTLLALAEFYPNAVGDDLNIPESGNGKSDLLDEVKYELDWLTTMQDEDGGVFFKVAPTRMFPGFILPKDDLSQRFVIGKSTTSALTFALVTAQAGRLYAQADPAFAADCTARAERAYAWARANPNVKEPVENSGSGSYGDTDYADEFFSAAAELYLTTGDGAYLAAIKGDLEKPAIEKQQDWKEVRNLGYFSLAAHNKSGEAVKKEIIRYADTLVADLAANPYGVPMHPADFIWGSNGVLLNKDLCLAFAFRLTGDKKYLAALDKSIDYIFGKNATGYSFVTGFGGKTPLKPHHRPIRASSVRDPVPGYLVGGPNKDQEDGQWYDTESPAKFYLDAQPSWSSNEVAINWNAPLVFVLGFLELNETAAR